MSNLKTRLDKLESILTNATRTCHIMRLVVDVGNNIPIAYQCDGVETYRRDDESDDNFKSRCHDSVHWPIGRSSRRIFLPIYDTKH